jgi:hypothetical protein
MAVGTETVVLMSTCRVGFLPPPAVSLAAGELSIEIAGTSKYTGTSGDIIVC